MQGIQQLPEAVYALRHWFIEFTENLGDKQIENDANAGKPDALAIEALDVQSRFRDTRFEECAMLWIGSHVVYDRFLK